MFYGIIQHFLCKKIKNKKTSLYDSKTLNDKAIKNYTPLFCFAFGCNVPLKCSGSFCIESGQIQFEVFYQY